MLLKRLHDVRRLTGPERRVALHAACLLPLAGAAIRVVRIDRVVRILRTSLSLTPSRSILEPRRVESLVNAVGSVLTARCLSKALALQALLAHQGTSSNLVIGTAVGATGLDAHAWLEDGASSLLVASDNRHTPLFRCSSRGEVQRNSSADCEQYGGGRHPDADVPDALNCQRGQ